MEKGDVVRLKSGGPNLVVLGKAQNDLLGDDKLYCKWFDFKGRLHQDYFYEACLEKVEGDGRE